MAASTGTPSAPASSGPRTDGVEPLRDPGRRRGPARARRTPRARGAAGGPAPPAAPAPPPPPPPGTSTGWSAARSASAACASDAARHRRGVPAAQHLVVAGERRELLPPARRGVDAPLQRLPLLLEGGEGGAVVLHVRVDARELLLDPLGRGTAPARRRGAPAPPPARAGRAARRGGPRRTRPRAPGRAAHRRVEAGLGHARARSGPSGIAARRSARRRRASAIAPSRMSISAWTRAIARAFVSTISGSSAWCCELEREDPAPRARRASSRARPPGRRASRAGSAPARRAPGASCSA